MKYYSRKVDNGCAIQIIEVTDEKIFNDIYFIENGNGNHYGLIPKCFEIGQKMVRGFLKYNGFKHFYPSDSFLNYRCEQQENEFDIENNK